MAGYGNDPNVPTANTYPRSNVSQDESEADPDPFVPGGLLADVIHNAPPEDQRLKEFTVMCLIFNRMIGSGIFTAPSILVHYTQSPLATMLLWLCGCVMAMCGIVMFIEYGLSVPRYKVDGTKVAVPKSGGQLNYIKYLLKWPPLFAVTIFGIAFVLVGHTATNALSFAIRVIQAAKVQPEGVDSDVWLQENNWTIRAIALAAVTGCCVLHAFWRTGGIYLNNIFAVVKVGMVVVVIITGFLAWGGVFGQGGQPQRHDFEFSNALQGASTDPYGYAQAYLTITFTFGGFSQANYVLGEIDAPRKRYKWPAFLAVLIICILFFLANVAYMAVVPASEQKQEDTDVVLRFFELTYGSLYSNSSDVARRISRGMMAVSTLGNIIVFTYTAARVKQEIAKEGILPFRKFLANPVSMPGIQLSRILGRRPKPFREEVPLGALLLHWIVSVILLLATAAQDSPMKSYTVLLGLYSWLINCFFGVCLAVGMLYLRFPWSGRNWSKKSGTPALVSVGAALIFGAANLFPLVAIWIPPTKDFISKHALDVPWYVVPVVSVSILALGGLWWLGLIVAVPAIKHPGQKMKIHRQVEVDNSHGYEVGVHDRLVKRWEKVTDYDEKWEYEEVVCTRVNHQYGA